MSNEVSMMAKIKEVILDIDPNDIIKDANDYGIRVTTVKDFAEHQQNYVFIEKLMGKYASIAANFSAVSGVTSGIGGPVTTIALGGVDIANMAAQLYRLNQKMAVLNGYDLDNTIHRDRAHLIYMKALGFDAAAQATIRSQMARAAAEVAKKPGPASNVTIRLIMAVAAQLGIKLTKNQAVKFVPFLGAALGGGMNYLFAKNAGEKMMAEYKSEYIDRWQANSRY